MTSDSNIGVLDAFKHIKVLIIGDSMIDTYSYGDVTRISPEAPVPVVRLTHNDAKPGGAANVALNIKALGAEPILCSVIGDDDHGRKLQQLLVDSAISTDGLVTSHTRKTTTKHRVLSAGKQLLRIDEEDEHSLSEAEEIQLLAKVQHLINDVSVVILQDYDKGNLYPAIIEKLLTFFNEKNVPVCVDPKFKNFGFYKGITLFKPNLKELSTFSQCDENDWEKQALSLQKESCEMLLVTLGSKGVFYSDGENIGRIEGIRREVADVSGAGDTVIAIAALGIASKFNIRFIAQISNLGGGLACEIQGVGPVELNSLQLEINQHPTML